MLDSIILAVLVYFATFLFMFFMLAFFTFWYISVPLLVIFFVIKFIRQAKECERIYGKLE
ncbi:transformation system protein [Campylobacter concisus]|uniref:Transformation system protein n=1 Tax=Campylobacter concisus TaxID=199 RepID=A0AAE7P1M6_9BACT|nr:transformation system protein [Campylobacter concisus]QPH86191.1 transformation system protein [Campylobacter concisus]